jgi:predicted branched-subunit amino acid permease
MRINSLPKLTGRVHQGMRAILPLLPGIVPFGLIAGVTPITLGYSWVDSILGSLLMFAGASQLAAYQLLGEGASVWVILMTVAAVNLRYLLYSASLAPDLQGATRGARWLAGYGLTDQIYAIAKRDYPAHQWDLQERLAYYAGGSVTIWLLWQMCTLTGAMIGQIIPVFWSLEFMIPLTFLALALNTLKTRAHRVAAVVGATVSYLGLDLPYNLGLIVGALSGIGAGILSQRWWR